MRNIFKINIFTYLFFLLYILSGYYKDILIIYFILFFHEVGHYFIMKYYKIDVESITFYPYGGMIKSNMLINTNSFKVLFISLAGILFQIILLGIFFLLYSIGIIDFNIYSIFFKYNVCIILFNLLPMYPLDGFKISLSILEMFINFKNSIKINFILSMICIVCFFIYLYLFRINNYVIIVFLLINLVNYIKEFKYIINKFYIERILYKLEYNGLVSVSKIESIYKNKFNYINGVGEDVILKNKYRV